MTVAGLHLDKLDVREGDLFVLTAPGPISFKEAERLRKDWDRFCPGAKCAVLTDGLKVQQVRAMVAGDLGL